MLDFPDSPVANDTFGASNGVTYTFDGTKWTVAGSGTGPYLLLAGGTMFGPIALAADPTTDPQAANKHYVDASINLAGNYLGTWAVASNTPNINAGGSISNANYVATTVNPATPETVPVGVPGIAGMSVANGDRIIWAAGLGVWQILRNAGLTQASADARYYLLTNPSGYQTAAQVTIAVAPYSNNVGRNRLHNVRFSINQRGYTSAAALAAGAYGHDRWKAGASGCTYTFTQSQPSTTITITAGSLQQILEAMGVEGGTYTLSWTGTAQGRVNAGSYAASPVTVAGLAVNTAITVEFNTGTLTGVQLEMGSVVTPLDYGGTTQQQLAQCQRFYTTLGATVGGYQVAGKEIYHTVVFPTQMRATPMVAFSGATNVNCSGPTNFSPSSQTTTVYIVATASNPASSQFNLTATADL